MAHATTRRRGFTLAEILVAIGIFAIGFIAVASLFPAAAYIQKQTVDDMKLDLFTVSVESMLLARKFDEADLTTAPLPAELANIDTDGEVHLLPFVAGTGDAPGTEGYVYGFGTAADPDGWSLKDRSYLSQIADPATSNYFWIPFIRDANQTAGEHEWIVYGFVVQRHPNARFDGYAAAANNDDPISVPRVIRLDVSHIEPFDTANTPPGGAFTLAGGNVDPDTNIDAADRLQALNVGDVILDNRGTIYRVIDADANTIHVNSFIVKDTANPITHIWYGTLGGRQRSSGKAIFLVPDAVETQ